MSVEQRLVEALRRADQVEPSADLWSRVVHSIDEDRAHRRRVRASLVGTAAAVVALGVIAGSATAEGPIGRFVRIPVLEAVETVALALVVMVLGPAIRRFGRGYAGDLWPAAPDLATAMVRLLDVAYGLVFTGYILLTAEIDATWSAPAERTRCLSPEVTCTSVGRQFEAVAERLGGLVLTIGVLHALTLAVLPVVALVSNSTRTGRSLPRWLVVGLVVVGGFVGMQVVGGVLVLLVGAAGG